MHGERRAPRDRALDTRAVLFALALLIAAPPDAAGATRTREEYRYFRLLSIDLQGRAPTRQELAAFEAEGFDLDAWIEDKLRGPAYAERLRRVYMDRLALEVGPAFEFIPGLSTLRRHQILGPGGQPLYVYFRYGQRRPRVETDGDFCLTQAETGLQYPLNAPTIGAPFPISQAVLDAYTVEVKPWWLYRDYAAPNPIDRYAGSWSGRSPGFVPASGLLTEPDGAPTASIRICKEEAQTAATGTVFTSGRGRWPEDEPPPFGRLSYPPRDTSFATEHSGEPISCLSGTALSYAADCGCGVGLERCMPGAGPELEPPAFYLPSRVELGVLTPLAREAGPQASWLRLWWSQEAVRFFDALFLDDRDFREVLTARGSYVNGPLAQFYRAIAPATCCGSATSFGYVEPEPLFRPTALPSDLAPQDTATWRHVEDRGPNASGLLTMPIFLTKYGSRRARAHALYKTFLCRELVAPEEELPPSSEPNLMLRPGCSSCHATLEPLAAYFARVRESDWTFLPEANFPARSAACAGESAEDIPWFCAPFYDPGFTDAEAGTLRGAYASPENADGGPAALAAAITSSDDFAGCVVENVAASFLGRPLGSEDAVLKRELTRVFRDGGLRMRALVAALIRSDLYRRANNLLPGAER
jgi:hypothetical protein